MSKKITQKAENLLNNSRATAGDLESLAAELRVRLFENASAFDNATKGKYASLIARLDTKANREKSSAIMAKNEKHKQNKYYMKRTGDNMSDEDSYEKPDSSVVISRNTENKYVLPDFFPASAVKGQLIWLNYTDMRKVKQSPKRVVTSDKTELVLTARIPPLWIGDLKVLSRAQLTAYRTTFEVQPVYNFERIKELNEVYVTNYEYMPVRKGELFYVRTPPVKANKPSNNFEQAGKANKIMPSKVAEYFVNAGGFIVFVNGITSEVLCKSDNVWDFVYTGTNHSNTSGRAFYVNDSIRKIVTENMQKFIALEREMK
jgi:hypothetical protein